MTVIPSSSINFVAVCLCLIAVGNELATRHYLALLLCAVDHLHTLLLLPLLFHIVHLFLLLLLYFLHMFLHLFLYFLLPIHHLM